LDTYNVRIPWDSFHPTLLHLPFDSYRNSLGTLLPFLKKLNPPPKNLASILGLDSMRFFDPSPDVMRQPSFPGQTVLGDRGENLSSVLYAICKDAQQKQALLGWLEELTPMDVVAVEFPADQIGRILVTLIERSGVRISAYSASDGTLRVLGLLAALLGPETSNSYFFEELENGVHPTRLYLLTHFIENQVAQGTSQVIASTHSPHLLNFLSSESLEYASLIYRLPEGQEARIKRIMDIPDAKRLIETQGIMRLHESGWFENVMYFLEEDSEALEIEEAV
jgi:hypothetical protein